MYVVQAIVQVDIIQMCSGITRDRVLNEEFSEVNLSALVTDHFMKISPQPSEETEFRRLRRDLHETVCK